MPDEMPTIKFIVSAKEIDEWESEVVSQYVSKGEDDDEQCFHNWTKRE